MDDEEDEKDIDRTPTLIRRQHLDWMLSTKFKDISNCGPYGLGLSVQIKEAGAAILLYDPNKNILRIIDQTNIKRRIDSRISSPLLYFDKTQSMMKLTGWENILVFTERFISKLKVHDLNKLEFDKHFKIWK